MTGILAIDTATEACSIAVWIDGEVREAYEEIPRQHNQRLFGMLEELVPGGRLRQHGIDAIAYSDGPGSFTGLRIAASAVQGLAYSTGLPAIGVSTLALLAQTALRRRLVAATDTVLCLLDARIDEVYHALCTFEDGLAVLREGPSVSAPAAVAVASSDAVLMGIGSGCRYAEVLPAPLRLRLQLRAPDLLPAAQDLVPLALRQLATGAVQTARQVQPVYVRDDIGWKKLAEQGRSA